MKIIKTPIIKHTYEITRKYCCSKLEYALETYNLGHVSEIDGLFFYLGNDRSYYDTHVKYPIHVLRSYQFCPYCGTKVEIIEEKYKDKEIKYIWNQNDSKYIKDEN